MAQFKRTLCQRSTATQENISVQVAPQVEVSACDRVVQDLVRAGVLEPEQLGVEEHLGCAEALGAQLHVGERLAVAGAARTLITFPSGSANSTACFASACSSSGCVANWQQRSLIARTISRSDDVCK